MSTSASKNQPSLESMKPSVVALWAGYVRAGRGGVPAGHDGAAVGGNANGQAPPQAASVRSAASASGTNSPASVFS